MFRSKKSDRAASTSGTIICVDCEESDRPPKESSLLPCYRSRVSDVIPTWRGPRVIDHGEIAGMRLSQSALINPLTCNLPKVLPVHFPLGIKLTLRKSLYHCCTFSSRQYKPAFPPMSPNANMTGVFAP